MTTEAALLQAIVDHPEDAARWLILADWLEEHDDPRRAELLRLHRQLIATCCEPELHPQRGAWQARVVELLTEGVCPSVPRRTVTLAQGVEMGFAWIPPGSFLMSRPPTEEKRQDNESQHRVTLTTGFWLAVTAVTQRQWQTVMRSNPSHFRGEDLPVEKVSWNDCAEFCRQLGERAGTSFPLPTEAEWEYACRAGTTTPFFFGETLSPEQANHGQSVGQPTAVGSYPCNAWGLFDMHGNVWEWCQDWYGGYPTEAVQDPKGPAIGTARVLRGGSWFSPPWDCRAAHRRRSAPAGGYGSLGLRPAFRLD